MSDKIYMGSNVKSLHTSPQLEAYDGIEVIVSEEESFFAGNRNGNTLQVSCPWGSQKIANDLLKLFRGYRYQPYAAAEAQLDPAAEIGDGVTVGRVYGGLYRHDLEFGGTMRSNFSAPFRKGINHEYEFKAPADRKVRRQLKGIQSTLTVQAGLIAAKVEATGGDRKSFAWELKTDHHSWFSDGVEVVRFEKDNFKFKGRIEAKSGLIGGFTIAENYLHTGKGTWGHCDPGEIYFGPEGINLSEKFYVRASGELYAESGTFNGTVRAGSIEYGGKSGYMSGGGIKAGTVNGGQYGQISGSTITTNNTVSAINSALGNGNYAADVLNGNKTPSATINFSTIKVQGLYWRGKQVIQESSTGYLKVT